MAIFDRAIRLMAIYDESHTFIVDEAIESAVAQTKGIMKKTAPYGEIYKLPGLLDEYIDAYSRLLTQMEEPVLEAIHEARSRVLSELEGKLCHDTFRPKFLQRFEELEEKATHCNNVATLQNIKVEADALKIRCLNEILAEETKLQAAKAAAEAAKKAAEQADAAKQNGETEQPAAPNPIPAPAVKKQRTVSIKSINTSTTWQVETAEDVKKYMKELEQKLLSQLEEGTILHIEF